MKSALPSSKKHFGYLSDGSEVELVTISRGKITLEVITYGAALRSVVVPDIEGRPTDVILGFDDLESYVNHDAYLGAVIGRCANRIKNSEYSLGGKTFKLIPNEGNNQLHGGSHGFARQNWRIDDYGEDYVVLSIESPDLQEGYSGNLKAFAEYRIEENSVVISFIAYSDKDTICNISFHPYFNLSGHNSGSVENQFLQVFADRYLPTNDESIPTGQIEHVLGTPMDFRNMRRIGENLHSDFYQIKKAKGFDHNYVLGSERKMKIAACAYSPQSGIVMHMLTDRPGIQVYTGNCLNGLPDGKDGAQYKPYDGFALEPQGFPDAVHNPNFPSVVLKAAMPYKAITEMRFSVE